MTTLIWQAPMQYYSPKDETAFFSWLQSIPGVVSVQGQGPELHIRLHSRKLSANAERELVALYQRYQGNIGELEEFLSSESAPGSGRVPALGPDRELRK